MNVIKYTNIWMNSQKIKTINFDKKITISIGNSTNIKGEIQKNVF